jgi:ribosomal protein S18 acetylase RimI-like enzyme
MSKTEPVTISMALGLSADVIAKVGAIDVSLNCDTSLFIDPLLLEESSNTQFRDCAVAAYAARFEQLIDLLAASRAVDDLPWRSAQRKLRFHEVPYTHLGYSEGVSGSGFGKHLTDALLANAKTVVDLGVHNENLFLALALFEEGVGADRISDMTTNIIVPCLAGFTLGICDHLGLERCDYKIAGATYQLPPNPLNRDEPILFVPRDIVRDLPVAADWRAVGQAAQETQDLRDRVGQQIGEIWRAKTKQDKAAIRDSVLHSRQAFETLLELLRRAADAPYDLDTDHRGEIYPADLRREIARTVPLDLSKYSRRKLSASEVDAIALAIIAKFKALVEDNGLWKECWNEARTVPRLEKAMQRLFFAVASAYCEANDLDISPESDAGCGPVDFKMSDGASAITVVEIKRSLNSKLLAGYVKQLETYKIAEGTTRGHYVVIDVGGLTPDKTGALSKARSDLLARDGSAAEIHYIDATPQKSASKKGLDDD